MLAAAYAELGRQQDAERERAIAARLWPLLDARTFADQFGTEEARRPYARRVEEGWISLMAMLEPTYRAGVRLVSVECLHLTCPKQAKRGFKTLTLCHDNRQLQTYGARRCLLAFPLAI